MTGGGRGTNGYAVRGRPVARPRTARAEAVPTLARQAEASAGEGDLRCRLEECTDRAEALAMAGEALEDRWPVRRTRAGRPLIASAALGFGVAEPIEWPPGLCLGPSNGKRPTWATPDRFRTTQKAVDADLVAEKMVRAVMGDGLVGDLEYVVLTGSELWVVNGHHALVARHCLGEPIDAWRLGRGPDLIEAPRLGPRPPAGPPGVL